MRKRREATTDMNDSLRSPAPPAAKVHELVDPAQLQAIASPPRQRLVAALEAIGPASVRELAEHLGRSAQSLYFHLRPLVACGLVEEAGERKRDRQTERIYRLVAVRLRIAGDVGDPDYRDAMAEMCRSVARAAERDYCRGLEAERARLHGRARNLSLHHYHVHLTPRDRGRFVKRIEELTEFVLAHNDPEHGELYSYTALFAPTQRPSAKETE